MVAKDRFEAKHDAPNGIVIRVENEVFTAPLPEARKLAEQLFNAIVQKESFNAAIVDDYLQAINL